MSRMLEALKNLEGRKEPSPSWVASSPDLPPQEVSKAPLGTPGEPAKKISEPEQIPGTPPEPVPTAEVPPPAPLPPPPTRASSPPVQTPSAPLPVANESSQATLESIQLSSEPAACEPQTFSDDPRPSTIEELDPRDVPAGESKKVPADFVPILAPFSSGHPIIPAFRNHPVPTMDSIPVALARSAAIEPCVLPHATRVSQRYLDLAYRIGEQVASNYCSTLLFVTARHSIEYDLSMTHLAQAFALQSVGKVLLVDGDLRAGELSQTVGVLGPGLTEAMLGSVPWSAIVHPTNVARVDFVPRGRGPMPNLEQSEWGWGALRQQYRAVLIGLAEAEQPQTPWMATRCDGVYFVISRPHTRSRSAAKTVSTLRDADARLLGCIVVND